MMTTFSPVLDVLGDAVQDLVVPEGLGQVFNVDHLCAASFPDCPGSQVKMSTKIRYITAVMR